MLAKIGLRLRNASNQMHKSESMFLEPLVHHILFFAGQKDTTSGWI